MIYFKRYMPKTFGRKCDVSSFWTELCDWIVHSTDMLHSS